MAQNGGSETLLPFPTLFANLWLVEIQPPNLWDPNLTVWDFYKRKGGVVDTSTD